MRHTRFGGITKTINLGELSNTYPELVEVLVNEYGLHCVGCMAAAWETLEEGARAHGFEDKQIEKIVIHLNKLVKNEKS